MNGSKFDIKGGLIFTPKQEPSGRANILQLSIVNAALIIININNLTLVTPDGNIPINLLSGTNYSPYPLSSPSGLNTPYGYAEIDITSPPTEILVDYESFVGTGYVLSGICSGKSVTFGTDFQSGSGIFQFSVPCDFEVYKPCALTFTTS